jgi:FG-GAP repeat
MKKIIILFYVLYFIPYLSFSQNVGIGTTTPSEKLHVQGNIKADTIKPNSIKLVPNAGAGKILTSDATGNANWQANSSAAGGSVGYGVWGDCATNGNISEYNPVVDSITGGGYFGYSVSISGNYAIVGAYLDAGPGGAGQGSATFFQYNGTNWVFMQKIMDVTGAANDHFGNSVSIFGNYAIVAANDDDIGANVDQGSVSFYQLSGGVWTLINKKTDPSGIAGERFGKSVSMSSNYAIVGADLDTGPAGIYQGSATIFILFGTSWNFYSKILDPTGAADDSFGYSVSISGNYAIIGSNYDDGAIGINQGSFSIFQFNGTNWVFMQKITDATGVANGYFGSSVSISGNYAIAGASLLGGIGQMSASIYRYNGSSWVLMDRLNNLTLGIVGVGFGVSVSISGDYAIVGAYADNFGFTPPTARGSATIYQRLGLQWNKFQLVADPIGVTTAFFGCATAIDGINKRFLIGAIAYANNNGKAVFGKIN